MFRIWLISLNRRQDRRCRTLRLLRGMACEVTIVDSYHGMTTDGQALSRRLLEAQGVSVFPWKIAGSSNAWWARDLKYGEIGCALAHLAAWEQIATCNAPGLVLEDDVHFTSMFWARLRARIEVLQEFDVTPDLMYLGRDAAGSAPEPVVAPGIVRPAYTYGTYGYMLWPRGARMLSMAGLNTAVVPADEFLSSMHTRHPRPDVAHRFSPQLNAVACAPPLLAQLPRGMVGSDTERTSFLKQDEHYAILSK